MVSLASRSHLTQTTPSEQPIPTPDNSQQKIYWSFNKADDLLDDNIIENDAPNSTGKGYLNSDDNETSITDKALQLGSQKQIEGKINALDMRNSGVSLSFWVEEKDNGMIPQIRLTQIVENVLEETDPEKNLQVKVFDALVIDHENTQDQLKIILTRPNASPDDGTNDGKGKFLEYTVPLNGSLSNNTNNKDWHHIVVLWNGEVNGTQGEIVDLVVIIDSQLIHVNPSETPTSVDGVVITPDDYYQNTQAESIPACRFIISASQVSSPTAIDEVRLIKGIVSSKLVRAFGSSRQTSGEPLIVWNADQRGSISAGLQLIKNGDFANGLEHWETYPSDAADYIKVIGDSLWCHFCNVLSDVGVSTHHVDVGIYQDLDVPQDFAQGKEYRLKFKAWLDPEKN
ncbi:hypothetical protein ACP6PL_02395 [Dapis sp. BLCC M126]|uniref:hypothetical protein n=1 Tax=Dapis sp. BLCC M126 TaxID=3400189 RepID=UPI003CF73E0C